MTNDDSRTGSTAGTSPNVRAGGELKIRVQITHVIEREFIRREIFPELRIGSASRVINGATAVHLVALTRARELVADAEEQRANPDLPRGLPVAYSALASNVAKAIRKEERHGVFDDPGLAVVKQRMAESLARFVVGDKVLVFRRRSDQGELAIVTGGFDLYHCKSADGEFIDRGGIRGSYRHGYLIRVFNTRDECFCPPHQLTREDCKPSHLRLVSSRPAAPFWRGAEGSAQ